MATAQEYLSQLKELATAMPQNRQSLSFSSKDEVKAYLTSLKNLQTRLRFIKREISQEIKLIRNDYKQEAMKASNRGALAGLLAGRGKGGAYSASLKRTAAAKRDNAIQPYHAVSAEIDNMILSIDQAKLQIQEMLDSKR